MLIQTIEIQVNNPGLIPQINAIQADSGRTLDCIISDMAIPAGATARIYAQKPSGAKVFNNCAISDRTVSVGLTTQILAELGRTVCQVQITQGTEKVTSFDFIINVMKSRIDSTAIESTDEFTALDEALAQADALLDNLSNQPITFTKATTVSELESGDTIAELFGQLKKNIEDGLFSTEDIIPVANGGTGATTAAAAIRNLTFLGVNPISSPSEDLPPAWTALGTGIAYIGASGELTSKPGRYGFVLNFTQDSVAYQLWLSMDGNSAIYARSGTAGGWYSSSANWVKVTMSAVEAANYVTCDELATAIKEGVNSYGV